MRVVCLQHVPYEGPGVLADLLRAAGADLAAHLVPAQGLPDDPGDLLLVMGGPMSVNDPDPWIAAETDFIRRAAHAGTPYLGVCLGSQFLAKALGGRVAPGPCFEMGACPVELTDAGRRDPALAGWPERPTVFQWHGEGIHAPPGAVALAGNAQFPVQAFRWGPRAYGTLFHLDVDAAVAADWCARGPDEMARAGRAAAGVVAEAAAHAAAWRRMAEPLLTHLMREAGR